MPQDHTELIEKAKTEAQSQGLDPALVCAVCEQESSWNTDAWRYEPAFEKRYLAKLPYTLTDKKLRSTSFGLMQIMGQVARELGYDGPLEGLYKPSLGLHYGCLKLAKCLKKSKGNVKDALQSYNGGGNSEYANQVLRRVSKYQ